MTTATTERFARRLVSLLGRSVPELRKDMGSARYMKDRIVPLAPERPDDVKNMPLTRLDTPGIDLDEQAQLARLESFKSERHQALFEALRSDPAINAFSLGKPAVSNTFCNTPDAEIYAAMILDRKPRRIVEVGSGFSTLVARKAVSYGGYDTRIVVTDPCPRTDVRAAADEVQLARVETTDLVHSDWSANDLLFIDSSHICRTRGDLPYLFCRLIPALPPGVLVHVHDIFLPFDYPNLFDAWCHTEEYLLACTLAHNRRYRTVFSTHWLSRQHAARMQSVFGPFVGNTSEPDHFGCSFWFEVRE